MPPTDPAAADSALPPSDPARKAGRAMALSLKLLLDRVPGAREVLPYIAALERGLSAEGTGVLEVIPLPSLRKMGAQLRALPVDLDDKPLRALHVQLQAALDRRGAPRPEPAPAPAPKPRPAVATLSYLPSTMDECRVEVTEVSASEWAAASEIMEYGPEPTGGQPR